MMTLLLPVGLRRAFFWAGESSCSGARCLVPWTDVCRPKDSGGLGVRDLDAQNRSVLMKLLHRLHHPSQSAWAVWLWREFHSVDDNGRSPPQSGRPSPSFSLCTGSSLASTLGMEPGQPSGLIDGALVAACSPVFHPCSRTPWMSGSPRLTSTPPGSAATLCIASPLLLRRSWRTLRDACPPSGRGWTTTVPCSGASTGRSFRPPSTGS